MNAKAIERRDMILEETEHLLDAGVWPPEIAARLGYSSVSGLQEAVRKWSPELRERLRRERWDRFAADLSHQWGKRVRSGF